MSRATRGEPALSPREAAFVTGLSEKTIHQAIDREEVQSLLRANESTRERRLGFADLVYLRLRGRVGRLLSPEGRRRFRRRLSETLRERREPAVVTLGALEINVAAEVEALKAKLAEVTNVRDFIVTGPDVRAGEPVVRGTRIPVYTLAELARQGAPRQELLEDYPSLTPESLDAALAYAHMYPRRGRPRRALWKNGVVIRQGTTGR